MNRKWILKLITIFITYGVVLIPTEGKSSAPQKTILATTFPIYQIVRNVTQGLDRVKVELMLPSQLGCPHDYTLTPQDMQKLAKADILVINGLGMEEFLGAPVRKANPKVVLIDSSIGIKETLKYSDGHNQGHNHSKTGYRHQGEKHHHHTGTNPHLFASPRMTARLAMNIAAGLSKTDPNGAATYFRNARTYAESMNKLANDMVSLAKRLKNNRIVQPHGVFDYLARDIGLTIVAVMQPHGQEPSAAEMMQLIRTMRGKRAGAIFTEPQYSEKVGKSLSKETGIPIAMLDPGASGPENAPLTYYETIMRRNMKTLESTLGVK